jgi:hypothetical protein
MEFCSSLRKCISGGLGILIFCLLSSVPASAQGEALPPTASTPAPRNSTTQSLFERDIENFHSLMSRVPLPSEGCFTAQYPTETWQKVLCANAPRYPNGLVQSANPLTVGGGVDYFAQVTSGNIFSGKGSFEIVSGVTDEWGARGSNPSVVFPTHTCCNLTLTPSTRRFAVLLQRALAGSNSYSAKARAQTIQGRLVPAYSYSTGSTIYPRAPLAGHRAGEGRPAA